MNYPPLTDIYCRTAASDADTQEKLEQQEAACRAYCEAHGLPIGIVYREVASGLSYHGRTFLTRMRRRYYSGEIQGVVVISLDRLSRSQVHLFMLMEEMRQHDTVLHCVSENADDSVTGKLVRFALGFMAEVKHEKSLDTLPSSFEQ